MTSLIVVFILNSSYYNIATSTQKPRNSLGVDAVNERRGRDKKILPPFSHNSSLFQSVTIPLWVSATWSILTKIVRIPNRPTATAMAICELHLVPNCIGSPLRFVFRHVQNMNFNLLHLHESVTCLIMNYNMNSIESILTRIENFYIRIELSFFYEVSHDVSCLRTKHTPTQKLVWQDGLPKVLSDKSRNYVRGFIIMIKKLELLILISVLIVFLVGLKVLMVYPVRWRKLESEVKNETRYRSDWRTMCTEPTADSDSVWDKLRRTMHSKGTIFWTEPKTQYKVVNIHTSNGGLSSTPKHSS